MRSKKTTYANAQDISIRWAHVSESKLSGVAALYIYIYIYIYIYAVDSRYLELAYLE